MKPPKIIIKAVDLLSPEQLAAFPEETRSLLLQAYFELCAEVTNLSSSPMTVTFRMRANWAGCRLLGSPMA